MKKLLFPVLCVLMASFTACGSNEPDDNTIPKEKEEKGISCNPKDLVFLYSGKETITLTANEAWSATTNVDWITITPSSGTGDAFVVIKCAGGAPEEGKIIFSTGKGSVVLPIKRWYGELATNSKTAVDLGLPSGLKWASSNVGASNVSDYGDYFAWGETTTKSNYAWSTYKYCKGSESTMTKYCTSSSYGTVDKKTTLESADDAAHVNWGGSWRMPTDADWTELRENCKWVWATHNDVKGYYVMGNGNAIFLPAASYRYGSYISGAGSLGYYWSSSLYAGVSSNAYSVNFDSSNVYRNFSLRSYGQSVRPVAP